MFEYKPEMSLFTSACLNVTDSCNLKCKYCMPAGTKIILSNWSSKNIEDIQIGDSVLAFEENDYPYNNQRKIKTATVTQLFRNKAKSLLKIVMVDGKVIYITKNHLVLDGNGEWTEVKNLREKTGQIMSLNYPLYPTPFSLYRNTIQSIEVIDGDFIVYNFETTEHTYFAEGLCVHNCFVQQKPHFITKDIAFKCVDYLYNNIQKSGKKHGDLTFFGGEPMLMYERIIVPTILYTEKKYGNTISFNITTNGTLLTKEVIDFFKEHNVYILLSMDGAKETQDFNRPRQDGKSSFESIVKNIPYLLEKFPETTFRATIDQESCENTFENYLFAIFMGFKHIFMTPNCRESWQEKNIEKLQQQIAMIYVYNSLIFNENQYPPISFSLVEKSFEWVLKNNIEIAQNNLDEIMIERSPYRCGLGTTSASFSFDGGIYACQEQDSYDNDSIFYIGNIFEGINQQKHKELLKKYCTKSVCCCEDSALCEDCNLRYLCQTAGCPSVNIDLYNNFQKYPVIQCRWEQMLYRCAEGVLKIFSGENENATFNNFLENNCNYRFYKQEGELNGLSDL